MKDIFDLTNRVAIVTGAASGLGNAIARGLARYGSAIAACDLQTDGLNQLKNDLEAEGRSCITFETDVTSEDSIKQAISGALEAFGKIDSCFNIAGINCRKPVLDLTLEEFDQVLSVNLKGVLLCAKAAGEVMVRQKRGKMINMASVYGHVAAPNQAAYASSKGALVQLTRVLALEWAPHNVQVNALCPGFFDTPLSRQNQANPQFYQELVNKVPMKRFGIVEEIVGSAIFLASDASNYMTGSSLIIDGGWTAN